MAPRSSAGRITSATACARSENIRPSSARASSEVRRESRRRLRMRSPNRVPPGWRLSTTSSPPRTSHSCSLRNCVDLPEPSSPSNVRKKPRGMAGVYSIFGTAPDFGVLLWHAFPVRKATKGIVTCPRLYRKCDSIAPKGPEPLHWRALLDQEFYASPLSSNLSFRCISDLPRQRPCTIHFAADSTERGRDGCATQDHSCR